jgi:hypothetical protein
VGKSTLVDALRASLSARDAGWGSGKCDEAHRNIPYFSLTRALRERVARLLTESAASLADWSRRLADAVGAHGRLVTDLVPELERVIGPQPEVADLPAAETRNRRDLVFIHFIQALAQTPFVLFLDDIQWADPATLDLLEPLAAERDGVRLLLILGRREEGAAPPGPTLTLRDLPLAEVARLLADTLDREDEAIAPLAALVTEKTRGNPFFLRQFLGTLHEDGWLRFDASLGRWTWDEEGIRRAEITDNVADLLTRRLRGLPADTCLALQTAALVGSRFDIGLLSIALDRSPIEVASLLRPALREGLVVAEGDGLELLAAAADASAHGGDGDLLACADRAFLHFLHDRVRQAAAAMLDPERAAALHLALGRRLRDRLGPTPDDDRLFAVVTHLDEAQEGIETAAERLETARLNYEAARRAARAGAYASAVPWLAVARALLDPHGWESDRALAVDVHLAAAVAASMSGDSSEVASLVETVRARAASAHEAARALEVQMGDDVLRGRYAEALETGRRALALLGQPFPQTTSRPRVLVHLTRVLVAISRIGLDRMAELPLAEGPGDLLLARILVRMGTAALLSNHPVLPHVGLMCVEHAARGALTPASIGGLASVGAVIIMAGGPVDAPLRLAEAALRVADRFPDSPFVTKGRFAAHHLVRHWKEPMRAVAEWTRPVFRRCLESGDFENGGMLSWAYVRMSYQCGVHLEPLLAEMDALMERAELLRYFAGAAQWEVKRRIIKCHMGQSSRRGVPDLDPAWLEAALARGEIMCAWTYAFEGAWMDLAWDRPLDALRALPILERFLPGMGSLPEVPYYHHLSAMARLAALSSLPVDQRAAHRAAADASLRRMRRWASWAPFNHAHRVSMIEALAAIVDGDARAAPSRPRPAASSRTRPSLSTWPAAFTSSEGASAWRGPT